MVIKHISCKSFANNLKIRCKFCPLKFQQGSKAEEQKGVQLGKFKNRNQTRVCSDQMRALYPLRFSAKCTNRLKYSFLYAKFYCYNLSIIKKHLAFLPSGCHIYAPKFGESHLFNLFLSISQNREIDRWKHNRIARKRGNIACSSFLWQNCALHLKHYLKYICTIAKI